MMNTKSLENSPVGPVLINDPIIEFIIAAIQNLHPNARIEHQGAYTRISVPHECRLIRKTIEVLSGQPFRFPEDLELIMAAFKGHLTISKDEALWTATKTKDSIL